jgi:hypothetical protein
MMRFATSVDVILLGCCTVSGQAILGISRIVPPSSGSSCMTLQSNDPSKHQELLIQ